MIDERLIAIGYGGAVGGDEVHQNPAGETNTLGHFIGGGLFQHSITGALERSYVWTFENDPIPEQRAVMGIIDFSYGSGQELRLIGGARVEDDNIIYTPNSSWIEEQYNYKTKETTTSSIVLQQQIPSYTVQYRAADWYCSIPIFEASDHDGIKNYIENGDYSSALNFDAVVPEDQKVNCEFTWFKSIKNHPLGPVYDESIMWSLTWQPSKGLEEKFANGEHSIELFFVSGQDVKVDSVIPDPPQPIPPDLLHAIWLDLPLDGLYQITYDHLYQLLIPSDEYLPDNPWIGMTVRVKYTDDDGSIKYTSNVYDKFFYNWELLPLEWGYTAADDSVLKGKNGLPDEDDEYEDPHPDSDPIPDGEGYSTIGLLTTTYALSEEQTRALGSAIWTGSFFENIKLLNNSPIENILSVKYFPMSLSGIGSDEIILGNVELGCYGHKMTSSDQVKFNIGSVTVPQRYFNFIDYVQTGVSINLPFSGVYQLPTASVMGKTLRVELIIDPVTGAGKYILYCNGVQFASYSAAIGIDLPITSSNRAQVEAGIIGSLSKTAVDVATENYLGAVKDVAGMAGIQNHFNTSGTSAPSCSCYETKHVFLIIDRPDGNSSYNLYGHSLGYKCNLSKKISGLSGYTECMNVDVSNIPGASDEERAMIKQLMEGGFYA